MGGARPEHRQAFERLVEPLLIALELLAHVA
jgi:hypothetical protein